MCLAGRMGVRESLCLCTPYPWRPSSLWTGTLSKIQLNAVSYWEFEPQEVALVLVSVHSHQLYTHSVRNENGSGMAAVHRDPGGKGTSLHLLCWEPHRAQSCCLHQGCSGPGHLEVSLGLGLTLHSLKTKARAEFR